MEHKIVHKQVYIMPFKNSPVFQESNPDQLRSSVRFPIHLPLRLKTDEGDIDAVTENISASGLLFSLSRPIATESRIEFTMAMPGTVLGSSTDVVVHCVGRVVRCYSSQTGIQAAAVIDEYNFVS